LSPEFVLELEVMAAAGVDNDTSVIPETAAAMPARVAMRHVDSSTTPLSVAVRDCTYHSWSTEIRVLIGGKGGSDVVAT